MPTRDPLLVRFAWPVVVFAVGFYLIDVVVAVVVRRRVLRDSSVFVKFKLALRAWAIIGLLVGASALYEGLMLYLYNARFHRSVTTTERIAGGLLIVLVGLTGMIWKGVWARGRRSQSFLGGRADA